MVHFQPKHLVWIVLENRLVNHGFNQNGPKQPCDNEFVHQHLFK
jgi:hypothetical protein